MLVDATDDDPAPDEEIVPVFSTTDVGLLPLATMTLDQARILHETRYSRTKKMAGGYLVSVDDGAELLVRAGEADRARDLLADLEHAAPVDNAGSDSLPSASVFTPLASSASAPVARFDKETGQLIGRLARAQFDDLDARLEHQSADDNDFYVDEATLVLLEEQGVDTAVVEMLRHACAGRSGIDVRWAED
ncbi:MAG: hypothetical protein ABI634_01140 [Acidobacteriota bacterium]